MIYAMVPAGLKHIKSDIDALVMNETGLWYTSSDGCSSAQWLL